MFKHRGLYMHGRNERRHAVEAARCESQHREVRARWNRCRYARWNEEARLELAQWGRNRARRRAKLRKWVRPLRDGDRDGLTKWDFLEAICSHELHGHQRHDALDAALSDRASWVSQLLRADPLRETHRAVHEALAGAPRPDCKWCREAGER